MSRTARPCATVRFRWLRCCRTRPDAAGGARTPSQEEADYNHGFRALGARVTRELSALPFRTVARAAKRWLANPGNRLFSIPQHSDAGPLMADGRPEVFYFGSEACPFCAVERWATVIALSQFGQFGPLALMVSSPLDIFPSLNTFTFYRSTYRSPVIAFAPDEACDELSLFQCVLLQPPTPAEQEVVNVFDPIGGFPFVDVANHWTTLGPSAFPGLLQGLAWEQIVAALRDPETPIAQNLAAGAEILSHCRGPGPHARGCWVIDLLLGKA